jgi:hypothetical protein
VISGNTGDGITSEAVNDLIAGNLIGTDATGGSSLPNQQNGITVAGGTGNTIGGVTAAARNVISGNMQSGVRLSGTANVVEGNFIGTDVTGTLSLGNAASGVFIDPGASNTVGGTTAGAGNLIAGNNGDGVTIQGNSNLVAGNLIGVTSSGSSIPNQGFGIGVVNGPNNSIGGVSSASNTIGGTTAAARNVISGNILSGVNLGGSFSAAGGGASANLVEGNFIGTNPAGTSAVPNGQDGIVLVADQNDTIGGSATGAGNVISGNTDDGIITDNASNALIAGNLIGTDTTGTHKLPNRQDGINLGGSTGTTIGGLTAGARNLISGNAGNGVHLSDSASNVLVQGNLIGTDITGTVALGNAGDGVLIQGNQNTVGGLTAGAGNIIAFNGAAGVTVSEGTNGTLIPVGDAILSNLIFNNAALGIDLGGDGVTPNDSRGHTGPNNFQNFPVLTQAQSSGGSTTITGTLNSTPSTTFTVQLFSNVAADPSGFGQGQVLLDTLTVTTDASGAASISATIPIAVAVGQFVTATATDAAGNTSEFSMALKVTSSTGAVLTAAGVTQIAAETLPITNGLVATFTDTNSTLTVSNYTATINWGDGTAATPGAISFANGTYSVSGSHTYILEGAYVIQVTITTSDQRTATANSQITVVGFITSLYETVLGRPADLAGLNFWLQERRSGVSKPAIAQAFWTSAEHFGDEVDQFYQTFLNRPADAAGQAFWVSVLEAGVPESMVAIAFLTSNEYTASHPDSVSYVAGLYEDVLSRKPDPAGEAFWVAILNSNSRTRADVAYYFLTSPEAFIEAIDDYYLEFLGRDPSPAEVQVFLPVFESGNATPAGITSIFLSSGEYLARELALAEQATQHS